MAYLQVDGITVPVAAKSDRITIEEIGSRGRAISGRAITGVRAMKRSYEINTSPMEEAIVEALFAMLTGRGVQFNFADTCNTTSGFVPPSVSNVAYLSGETAADATGTGQHGVKDVPFGAHLGFKSLQLNIPTTNLLSAETASFVTGAGDAVAVDSATIARDANVSIDGTSGALKVTTASSSNSVRGGVYLPTSGNCAASAHTGSCYLRASTGTPSVRVYLATAGGVVSASVTVALTTTDWVRVHTPALTMTAGEKGHLYILEETADSGIEFYVDQAQIEALNGPSKWLAGATTRSSTGRLQIVDATRTPFTGWPTDWSFNVWVRGGADAVGYIYYVSATNYLRTNGTAVQWATPASGMLTGTYAIGTGAWSMITCSQYVTDTGTVVSELWINGVLASTNTSAAGAIPFEISDATSFDIGSNGSAYLFSGPIASVTFLPCRLPTEFVTSLYNSGSGARIGNWPRHRITGDIVGSRTAMDALIKVDGIECLEYAGPSGWINNARSLQFTIQEV